MKRRAFELKEKKENLNVYVFVLLFFLIFFSYLFFGFFYFIIKNEIKVLMNESTENLTFSCMNNLPFIFQKINDFMIESI